MDNELYNIVNALKREKNYSISKLFEKLKENEILINKEELYQVLVRESRSRIVSTPPKFISAMIDIARIFKGDMILDPACGTGMITHFCDFAQQIDGYDINYEAIEIAKYLNDYRHNYMNEDFIKANISKRYDMVISHFPWGGVARDTGIKGHYEKLFVEKSLRLLKDDGVLICLVPDNFLSFPYSQELRQVILNSYSLEMIINIPKNLSVNMFMDSSILVIQKKLQRDKVYLALLDNNLSGIIENYHNQEGDIWVGRERLKNRWDRHFHGPIYENIESELKGKDFKILSEMAEIKRGIQIRKDQRNKDGKYLIYSNRNIHEGRFERTANDEFVNKIENRRFEDSILQEGDIIVNLIFDQKKLYVYKKSDPPAIITSNFAVIRSKDNKYIRLYLTSESGQEFFKRQADGKSSGSCISSITIRDLGLIKIPILELEDLNDITQESLVNSDKIQIDMLIKTIEKQQLSNESFKKEILTILTRIEKKIDNVLEILTNLQVELSSIKSTMRSEEEKLQLIYAKIDRKLLTLKEELKEEIEVYEELLKNAIDNWDILEPLSKEILPIAEYLFDKLIEIDGADYSPVILEYCRSLENEFLKKLFIEFTNKINEKYNDIDGFLSQEVLGGKTNQFARYIKKYKGKTPENIKYTLGEMQYILSLTSGSNTISKSPLLQEFKKFISEQYKGELLLSREYLDRIDIIVNNFRNKCAHPYKLSEEDALSCKNRIPEDINHFIESFIK